MDQPNRMLMLFPKHLWKSAAFTMFSAFVSTASAEPKDWLITNKLNGIVHNTNTGTTTIKGVEMRGLTGVVNRGGHQLKMYWERGAANQTIELDGNKLVVGQFQSEAARLGSIRLSNSGSLAYLKSSKGPKANVKLIQDGKEIHSWPRRTNIKILGFNEQSMLLALYLKESKTVELFKFQIDADGRIDPSKKTTLGQATGCVLMTASAKKQDLYLELICKGNSGRGIFLLNDARELEAVSTTESDEVLSAALLRSSDASRKYKNHIGAMTLKGSPSGLAFLASVNALLLRELGEPVSLASDEAGKQSWAQSYRTLSLAELYQKTKYPVFATLAKNSMKNTLSSTNSRLKLTSKNNPSCGWASRIYSEDKSTPISFFINQAIIMGSLIRSCKALGNQCPRQMSKTIDKAAACLVDHYEPQFDNKTHLYRIGRDIPFRFDGIWAPWNWQTSMAVILKHVGETAGSEKLSSRADKLIKQFLNSVEYSSSGTLWKYWPPRYYAGWAATENISSSKPSSNPKKDSKYEDLNHAGISLAAVCDWKLPNKFLEATRVRLEQILSHGNVLPRNMNGQGPTSSTWQLAYGWDCLKSPSFKQRFSKLLANATFGPTLLSYARQFNTSDEFEIVLNLSACKKTSCEPVRKWTFSSPQEYLEHSPFFKIEPVFH